MNFQLTIFSWL